METLMIGVLASPTVLLHPECRVTWSFVTVGRRYQYEQLRRSAIARRVTITLLVMKLCDMLVIVLEKPARRG